MKIEDSVVTNEAIEKKEAEIKEISKVLQDYKNKDYTLTKELNELKMEECKKRIGRCFIKGNMVYRITEIDDFKHYMNGPTTFFNEYLYKTIAFEYPFNNSLIPFKGEKINLCSSFITAYKEISKEEFDKMFTEVNEAWKQSLA